MFQICFSPRNIYSFSKKKYPYVFLIRSANVNNVEQCGPQDTNHVANNNKVALTQPEIHNNERNREADREHAAAAAAAAAEEDRKQRDAERYGFHKESGDRERPLTKINSIKLQPQEAAGVRAAAAGPPPQAAAETDGPHLTPQVNGLGEPCQSNGSGVPSHRSPAPLEQDRSLSRTSSMQQLEQWVRTQRGRSQDDDTRRSVFFL